MKTTDKEAWNDWTADSEPRPCVNPRAGFFFIRGSNSVVCGVTAGGGLARRNLIAAAPDLLAACKAWLAEAKAGLAIGVNADVIEQTEAAIARAEGRE